MNNGIDLDAIPGQKAARNRAIVRNPPVNLEMSPTGTETSQEQTTITFNSDITARSTIW